MFLFHFLFLYTEKKECSSVPENVALLKYTDNKDCINCDMSASHFNEVNDRLASKDITIKRIDCNRCDCASKNIKTLPTLVLYNNKEEVDRLTGLYDYHELVNFLINNTTLDKNIFYKRDDKSAIVELYERDFIKPFTGPWLIVFYKNKSNEFTNLLKVTAENYPQIKIGMIHKRNAKNISIKYNLNHFPSIIAFNDGISSFYVDELSEKPLFEFLEKLLKKTFVEIDDEYFEKLSEKYEKEPFFVVFYNDLRLANSYFKEKSHLYKLRTNIYRTNNIKLMERAGIFPASKGEDEEKIILMVYKNKTFHKFPGKLDNENDLISFIFHSHFPHLTEVSNNNFDALFHGLKPVLLLLTNNDRYNDILETFSKKISHGLPYVNLIMATIDTNKYPSFVPGLLPNIDTPSIVIFDPVNRNFFYKRIDFRKFENELVQYISDYIQNRLQAYPHKRISYITIILIIGVILTTIAGLRRVIFRRKSKEY